MEDHRRRIPDTVMRRRVALAVAVALIWSGAATADERALAYPSFNLAPDEIDAPGLAEFVADSRDALWRYGSGFGKNRPPSPAGDVFAETVTVFVGGRELVPDDGFEKIGRFRREEILSFLGQFLADKPIWRAGAESRGAQAVNGLLSDGMIAENDLLDGQSCTGSFDLLSFETMRDLLTATDTTIDGWGVAAARGDKADYIRGVQPLSWDTGQLLHVDEDAPPIRSCCWDFVVTPDGLGAYVQMGFGGGPLLSYLSSHACFARTEEGWRVSAVAIRM